VGDISSQIIYNSGNGEKQGRTQGRGFGGRNLFLLKVKETLLMADLDREL